MVQKSRSADIRRLFLNFNFNCNRACRAISVYLLLFINYKGTNSGSARGSCAQDFDLLQKTFSVPNPCVPSTSKGHLPAVLPEANALFLFFTDSLCRINRSALDCTLYHAVHDLFLPDQEDNNHRDHRQQRRRKDQIPLLYIGTDKRLHRHRQRLYLAALAKHQ